MFAGSHPAAVTLRVVCCTLLLATQLSATTAHGQVPAGRRPYASTRYGGNYLHNYLIPPAPGSTPWLPEWSPDGQWIAVGMGGSIWRVDLTGRATELVAGARYYAAPAVSPDGRWMVYTADDGGRSVQLEAMELGTRRTVTLTSDAPTYLDPRWSPDGRRLAYVSSQPNGYLNVMVREIRDGAWVGDAIALTQDSNSGKERPYFTAQDMHITPAWLPNGRELMLISNAGVALGSGHVVRVPVRGADSSAPQVVLREHTFYQTRPHISPDGRWMAYSSSAGGRRHTLALRVRDLISGADRALVNDGADALQPRWSPDGKRIAFVSNAEEHPQLAVVDVATGVVRRIPITARTYRRPMATLRLHVRDSQGPTAARVHLTGADGRLHTPVNAVARQSWMNDRVFHMSDMAEIPVPAGAVRVDVVKGFEHRPQRLDLTLREGETRDVEVYLQRMADMPDRGWYAGSTGVHLHDEGPLPQSLAALLPMARAEDVWVVANPLAHHDDRIADHELWSVGGQAHPASSGGRYLVLGQEHRPGFYGHVAVFGSRRRMPSLYKVTVGYEGNPGPSLGESNTDILRSARQDGAFTAYVHAFAGEEDPMRAALGLGKAFVVDAALGLVDGLEWASAGRGSFVPWYALLNNGIRTVALGGEDTIANLYIMRLMGSVRTYVACRGPLSAAAWWENLRRGKAFVTTGPLVDLTVNGAGIGEEVRLPAGGGRVTVRAWVRSITPLQKVLLVQNGQVVADLPLVGDRMSLDTTVVLDATSSGWIHLRAEGSASERYPLDALYAQAFTNPTWLTVDGRIPRDAAAAEYGLKWIDMLQVMADAWPGWTNPQEKAHVFAQFDTARGLFRQLRSEATGLPPQKP